MFELRNYLLTDSSQVINVLNNQIDCFQSEIYILRKELRKKCFIKIATVATLWIP